MNSIAIGIIGPNRSGKDTAAKYLSQKLNLPIYQISSAIKDVCLKQGLEPTRENLIKMGSQMANEHSDGYLAERIIEIAPESFIATGMRQLGQIKILKSLPNFVLISIDALPKARFLRAQVDKQLDSADTLEKFIQRETAENNPPNAQRLFECMKMADYQITNNGTTGELNKKLDKIIQQIFFN